MKGLELLISFHRQEKTREISNKSEKIMFLSCSTFYLIVTENVKNTWKNIFLNKAFWSPFKLCAVLLQIFFLIALLFYHELGVSQQLCKAWHIPASFCKDATPALKIYYIIQF